MRTLPHISGAQRAGGPGRGRSIRFQTGAILLEVIVALGLLVFGMSVVGLQVRMSLQTAREVDLATRAMMLADTILAELDAGAIRPDTNDDEIRGDFGSKAPGFSWRIGIEPADVDNLYMITLDIGFNPELVQVQIDNPEEEIEFDEEGTTIVQRLYRLYPTPADVNVERDYGMTPEDLQAMLGLGEGDSGDTESVSDAGQSDVAAMAAEQGIDMTAFDFLFDPSGFDPRQLSQLPEEEFLQLVELLQTVFQQGGSALNAVKDQLGTEGVRDVVNEGRRRRNQDNQGEGQEN